MDFAEALEVIETIINNILIISVFAYKGRKCLPAWPITSEKVQIVDTYLNKLITENESWIVKELKSTIE